MKHPAASLALVLAFVTLVPAALRAEYRRVELAIAGMDWATCAHAVSVAVRKLEGVESVEVSLQRGVADIRLRQGNSLTLARLRQLVRQNGFNARDAVVTVTGRLTTQGKAPALGVTGPDSVLILAADPAQRAAFDAAAARLGAGSSGPVTLEGTVRAGTNPASPDVLVVRRVVP